MLFISINNFICVFGYMHASTVLQEFGRDLCWPSACLHQHEQRFTTYAATLTPSDRLRLFDYVRTTLPSFDHVDRDHVDHVPSSSAELRPPRPQDYVAMMIAAKNGATTIVTTVKTTGRKARGPDNFIANDTSSHLSNIATRRLLPPVVNKAKYYF